jgi:hypothetical protein
MAKIIHVDFNSAGKRDFPRMQSIEAIKANEHSNTFCHCPECLEYVTGRRKEIAARLAELANNFSPAVQEERIALLDEIRVLGN